jgi:hypothetical protein
MAGYKEHLLVLCLFIVLVFLFTVPFALRPHNAVISSHVDNLLNVWIISWDAHALTTNPTALYQANMNHPSPDSLAFSEDLFSLALVAAPIAWITGNAVFSYNLVLLVGFALCGYAMYLLVKYLTGNRPAAFVAGVFFAFVPYHFSTIVHVHVSIYFLQPLILLFLFRWFDEGRPRYLVGLGAAFTAQALMSWYQLAFSSIPIGLFLLWRVLSPRRREYARKMLYAAGVLVLCMLLVIPFALPYFRLHRNIPEGEREPAINVIASAKSGDFLRVLPQNLLYDKLGFFNTGSAGEGNSLFPGFLVFPLAALALMGVFAGAGGRRRRRRLRPGIAGEKAGEDGEDAGDAPLTTAHEKEGMGERLPVEAEPAGLLPPGKEACPRRDHLVFFAVLGLICFILSLGPEPHGVSNVFYKTLHKLPIYGFVRFPVRYHIMVLMSLAVFAGYGAAYLYQVLKRRKSQTWAVLAVAAVSVLMLLEFLVVDLPYTGVAVGDAVPLVYRDLEKIDGAVVVEAPMPFVANSVIFEEPLSIDYGTLDNTFLSAMREQGATYFSIYHWKETLNGMSGYYPLFYRRALVEMLSFPGPRALAFLRGAGVSHIVIRWDYYPPQKREEARETLAEAEGVSLIEDYPDGISLYELVTPYAMSDEVSRLTLYTPARVSTGRPFSASLAFINEVGIPFANRDESRQHLRVEWRDAGGKVVMSGETHFYAPFFIADGEAAAAPFKLSAPREGGSYRLVVTATGGLLDGRVWEAEIEVGEVATVDSAQAVEGSLKQSPGLSGIDPSAADETGDAVLSFYPGEVFSMYVEVSNGGPTQWERERASIEGSVAITAVWNRAGDPSYEMVQQGMLPSDVSPGQSAVFPIALQAPTETGSYTLTLRLNCLGITYIGDPVIIPIEVSP